MVAQSWCARKKARTIILKGRGRRRLLAKSVGDCRNEILTAIMEKTATWQERNDDTLISLIIPKNLLLLMWRRAFAKSDSSRALCSAKLLQPRRRYQPTPPLMMMMMEIEGKL
jgi:hypothetical protein